MLFVSTEVAYSHSRAAQWERLWDSELVNERGWVLLVHFLSGKGWKELSLETGT